MSIDPPGPLFLDPNLPGVPKDEAEILEWINYSARTGTVLVVWYQNPDSPSNLHWRMVQPIVLIQGPKNKLCLFWEYGPATGYAMLHVRHLKRISKTDGPGVFSSSTFRLDAPVSFDEAKEQQERHDHPFDRRRRGVKQMTELYRRRMWPGFTDPLVIPNLAPGRSGRRVSAAGNGTKPRRDPIASAVVFLWRAARTVLRHPYTLPITAAAVVTGGLFGLLIWFML